MYYEKRLTTGTDVIVAVVIAILCCIITMRIAYIAGEASGREQVFNGSYACMKLPDNTAYCYKVESKN